jgi:DNA repair protein RecO
VTYFERERRELVSLNDVDTLRSPLSLDDAARLGHVGYFAELLDAWAADADADERLYRLGAAAVDALTGDVPLDRLARYFEYWLLRLQGVYPPIQACHACGEGLGDGAVVGADDRVFVCRRCAVRAGGVALSRDAMAFLGAAAGTPVSRLASLPWSARTARELEAAHRRLIVAHLDKELKSPRVLRELGAPPGSRASAADGRRRLDGSV